AEIAERRRAGDLEERDDILSLLLQARHEDDSPMSDIELRNELMTLLVAGHETTANALAWAIERLIRHPDKLDRLTEETKTGETEYVDAVITEKQEQTRGALLRAASKLFCKRGLEGTSIDEVAEAAGYTKGAFYANFKSKEELFLVMLDERFAKELERIDRTLSGTDDPETEA